MMAKHGIKTIAFEGGLALFFANSCIILSPFQLDELCRHRRRETKNQVDLHRKRCYVLIQNDFYLLCIENRRIISHVTSRFSKAFTDINIINFCEIAL